MPDSSTTVLIQSPPHTPRPELWTIASVPLVDKYGLCHFDAKRIELHTELGLVDLVDTIAHEVGHAVFPDLKERAIDRLAAAISQALLTNPRLSITLREDA